MDQQRTTEDSGWQSRMASITQKAAEVFGSVELAHEWFRRPNRALAERAPLSLLDNDNGARQVESVLGRLEHGLFS